MGVTRKELFTEGQNKLASLAKVISHPARVAIIEHLLKSKQCINSDLVTETGLAQATVSQHLRELKEAGIIRGTIEGTSVSYCLDPEGWKLMSREFNRLFSRFSPDEAPGCC
ncbi:ArsR/SmtB family transcription factor [Roseivirga sp. BDSF3-8]|uniref:ArsR/SmtB family transcription factor n=1 Tax=Roseivirga sp. BDSF3-8 TaxID=3241598 RepID=UPI003531BB30